MAGTWIFPGEKNPCLKSYMEEESDTNVRAESQNMVQLVFACDKSGPKRRMQNNFVFIAGYRED